MERGQYPPPKRTYCEQRTNRVHCDLEPGPAAVVPSLSASRIPVIRSCSDGPIALCVWSKVPPWTNRRPLMPRSPRSSAISARARSCGSARTTSRWTSRRSPTGSLGLDIALGIGGLPRGRVVEIYGPESSGKTTLALHCRRRSPEEGRHLRLRRRRARARPDLCPQARRQCRRPPDLAARHRRAGAGDRRHAGALGRDRRAGDRFGRRAGAARRARRRDGRRAARAARRG